MARSLKQTNAYVDDIVLKRTIRRRTRRQLNRMASQGHLVTLPRQSYLWTSPLVNAPTWKQLSK